MAALRVQRRGRPLPGLPHAADGGGGGRQPVRHPGRPRLRGQHRSRGLALVELTEPAIVRGEDFAYTVRIQNTGAGHSFPTGSPFKTYRVRAQLLGTHPKDLGKPLAEATTLDLARVVEDAPPWKTVSDNRIPAGGEATFDGTFNVNQRKQSQRALLRVEVRAVVEGAEGEALITQEIPVQVL